MANQNYLCVQRSQKSTATQGEKPSPEQMQKIYAQFNAWREKYQHNLVDMGGKLGGGKVVTVNGEIDGPFAEIKEVIGGYMIVSAGSLEEAVTIATGCPGIVNERSSIEVREIRTS